ncbi:LA_2272 family surface repeat-containing protein [Arundinibacter roseus]|uniref:Uncharacterized protein n=1 Tax=Arundinibacter roseus TaxID=2070510 RepID=A0A4R4KIP1_9BACT|nr:hypothetical protein [Arundinibacter roseus]TDB68097.1 hypothetical protein EZE20_04020 [Arundinibacter roseus]
MKKITHVLVALLLVLPLLLHAQADETTDEFRPVQFTFLTPIGTNGLDAVRYVNGLSVNMLGGVAKGLDGVEFSGIFAIETHNVKGGQFAGIFNAVGGQVRGAQFAGIANLVAKNVHGAQFGGIANISGKEVDGGQFAGIANLAIGVEGAQVSGILNVAAGRVKGAQIGLINLAEEVDGVQIGLINYAKNGYRRVEFWASDVLYANAGFKMGGNRSFYTIFTAGATWPDSKTARWGYGLGFGTNRPLGKKNQLSLEGISYHINERKASWQDLNQLNQLRASFIFPLRNRLALTVTPTFNVQVSQLRTADGSVGAEWVDWHVYNKVFNNRTRLMMWPGLNVGIQF